MGKYLKYILVLVLATAFLCCERKEPDFPDITLKISPKQGQTTTIFSFDLTKTFEADPNNRIFVRWDWDGDGIFETPFLNESILSHRYLAAGQYTPRAEIKDLSGQTAISSFNIQVGAGHSNPRAAFTVSPENGNIYTEFKFDASTTQDDEDSLSTLKFKWDFDGDDIWDTELDNSFQVEHIYPEVRYYQPRVSVEDPSGRTSTYELTLNVTLLDTCIVPVFTTIPENLIQNEETVFDASSSTYNCNPDEQLWYRWDFNNDNFFDTDWLEDPVITHVFPVEQEYWVKLVVRNSRTLENSIVRRFWINHQNQPPKARIAASTYGGNTKTKFRFDGWPSKDLEDSPSQMLNRWDFDGDGIWDTELSHEMERFHTYDQPGVYQMAFEIIDRDELRDTVYETIYISNSNNETDIILDRRGTKWEHYGTVKIGNQWWMSRNLSVDYPLFYGNEAYNRDLTLVEYYGYLYNQPKMYSACPEGWRFPSRDDWDELFTNLDEEELYEEFVLGGNSGFNAVHGGEKGSSSFSKLDKFGNYWSSTKVRETTSSSLWYITFDKANRRVLQGYGSNAPMYSVRCIKE